MNEDLMLCLKKNGVVDVKKFKLLMDYGIVAMEKVISSDDLFRCVHGEMVVETVPISKIVGCSKSNLKSDTSFLDNFKNFFDSHAGDTYHSRGLSLLEIPIENVISTLELSFDEEPIKTVSVDDKYFIAGNGLHRFMILRLYYMIELYRGKSSQELDEKYKIKIVNKKIDVFKTFASSIGSLLNPPILFLDEMSKQDWLEEVKNRIIIFQNNPDEYHRFVSNIAYTFFGNGEPGETIICFLNTYFPTIFNEVVKLVCHSSYYECIVDIIECIDKYFPEEKERIMQIINQILPQNNLGIEKEKGYTYFDLSAQWNNFGQIKDVSNEPKSQRDRDLHTFSEGSSSLEKCLKILWKKGLKTIACCKGNHISISCDNNPEISCEAYIAFDSDSDWLKYLPIEIIEDEDVMITQNAIYYYGKNKDTFFETLTCAVLFGEKDNEKSLIKKIGKEPPPEMEYKSFIYSLQAIGFAEEQILELSKLYLEIEKQRNEFYSFSKNGEISDTLKEKWQSARAQFDSVLISCIKLNNEYLQDDEKLI